MHSQNNGRVAWQGRNKNVCGSPPRSRPECIERRSETCDKTNDGPDVVIHFRESRLQSVGAGVICNSACLIIDERIINALSLSSYLPRAYLRLPPTKLLGCICPFPARTRRVLTGRICHRPAAASGSTLCCASNRSARRCFCYCMAMLCSALLSAPPAPLSASMQRAARP